MPYYQELMSKKFTEEELKKNGIKSMSYYSGLSANERLMVLSEFERK